MSSPSVTDQKAQKPTGLTKTPLDEYFYAFNTHLPYQSSSDWLEAFDAIARRIFRQIKPGTVLDISCAYGLLVERLRAYGIQAYGIESDPWAIEQFLSGVKEFCWQSSPATPLSRRYDLIISLEGFKRLRWSDAQDAIADLCQNTRDALISVMPFHFEDASIHSPYPPEDWAEVFARHHFMHDLDFDLEPMTPWAMRFQQTDKELPNAIRDYEQHYWMDSKEIADLREIINANQRNLHQKELEIIELTSQTSELLALRKEAQTLTLQVNEMSGQILAWHNHWMSIQNSRTWRLFQALQRIQPRIAPAGSRRSRFLIWGFENTRKLVRTLRGETSVAPLIKNNHRKEITANASWSDHTVQVLPGREPLIAALYSSNPWTSAVVHLRLAGQAQHDPAGLRVLEGVQWGDENPLRFPEETQVVVIQRDFPRHEAYYQQVTEWARSTGKPIIYELDDLLTELPEDHPEQGFYADFRAGMLEAMRNADAAIVSTLDLANYTRQYNSNTWLLPNYIDDQIWAMKPKNPSGRRKPIVIGYMGGLTKTHLPDLEIVTPLLRRLLMRYKDRLCLRFWGVCPPELEGLPNVEFPQEKFTNYLDFARFFSYQDCDLFIAPLRKNLFNCSKSAIKYLEYSSLGIPGVYSRLAPYEQVVRDGWNGFLAEDELEWEDKITQLIEDTKLRIEMGQAAYSTVDKNWRMSRHAHEWGTVYRAALAYKVSK